jgi:hypothetical protein
MWVLQHAALQHAAVHVSGQHTVWRKKDISTQRIRRTGGGVKLGFLMLQIEKMYVSGWRLDFGFMCVGSTLSRSECVVRRFAVVFR